MNLREELQKITETLPVGNHPPAVEALRRSLTHSIQVLEYPNPRRRFNCFAHAFGTEDSSTINDLLIMAARRFNRSIAFGSDLASSLISLQILSPNPDGAVVIYFQNSTPVHGGRRTGDRVVSKWGIGCLWEHETWEVPDSYGDHVEYFEIPSVEAVEEEFVKYCKQRNLS